VIDGWCHEGGQLEGQLESQRPLQLMLKGHWGRTQHWYQRAPDADLSRSGRALGDCVLPHLGWRRRHDAS
jgi:hypothetical protein